MRNNNNTVCFWTSGRESAIILVTLFLLRPDWKFANLQKNSRRQQQQLLTRTVCSAVCRSYWRRQRENIRKSVPNNCALSNLPQKPFCTLANTHILPTDNPFRNAPIIFLYTGDDVKKNTAYYTYESYTVCPPPRPSTHTNGIFFFFSRRENLRSSHDIVGEIPMNDYPTFK